jgi:two-component system nitrogen regulation response regulator GlnG
MKNFVLLIAAEAGIIARIEGACETAGARLRTATSVDESSFKNVQLVICAEADFPHVRKRAARMPVLIYGDANNSERAIEAIKHGAIDYIVRSLTATALATQIQSALRVGEDVARPAIYDTTAEQDDDDAIDRIVGQSPAMQDVYKFIGRVAPRDINVLITGESGTGKELVARAILHHSPRRDKTYLAVNCAAIPETLLESELFGHEKGAFTGADSRRIGKFEHCHRGTLFLDEIGDIPLSTQAKLLRVLQDQTFQRLGGSGEIRCDVRIIAATHQPLDQLIAQRKFRPDLYYRLNVSTIDVPPLREREVDVILLAHYFVERFNRQFGTQVTAFAPETLPILLSHTWPGNVRELENAIKATLVMVRGHILRPEFLPEAIREGARNAALSGGAKQAFADPASLESADADPHSPRSANTDPGRAFRDAAAARPSFTLAKALADRWLDDTSETGEAHARAVAEFERALIAEALTRHAGRIAPVAKQLGLSRPTIRRKMRDLGIDLTAT